MARCNEVCELRCHDLLSKPQRTSIETHESSRASFTCRKRPLGQYHQGYAGASGDPQTTRRFSSSAEAPPPRLASAVIMRSADWHRVSAFGPFERGSYSSLHPLLSPSNYVVSIWLLWYPTTMVVSTRRPFAPSNCSKVSENTLHLGNISGPKCVWQISIFGRRASVPCHKPNHLWTTDLPPSLMLRLSSYRYCKPWQQQPKIAQSMVGNAVEL